MYKDKDKFWDTTPIYGNTGYRKVSTKGKVPKGVLRQYPSGFAAVYRSYLQGALRREMDFMLTPAQAYDVLTKPCEYCGSMGINCTLDFAYSGIDRIHSNAGYTIDNVVSCCRNCNRMKGKLTSKELIAHAKRIVEHNE